RPVRAQAQGAARELQPGAGRDVLGAAHRLSPGRRVRRAGHEPPGAGAPATRRSPSGGRRSMSRPQGPGSFLGRAGPLVLARLGTALLTISIPLVLARWMALREYGTYKQLFLISQTLSYVLPLGMAQSLYFFIPRADQKRPYFVQSISFLTITGLLAALGLFALEGVIGRTFSNPDLARYRWEQAIYVVCFMASYTLEISLTTQGRTRQSAVVYLVSDTLRAAAMVAPVLLGFGLEGVMVCCASFAVLRYLAAWVVTPRSGKGPLFDRRM